jgi:hypothetical protein
MFDSKFEDFMSRHKAATRDPTNPRVWLFETGAIYVEAAGRADSVAREPSPIPAERLSVQRRYLDAVYRKTWTDFRQAESRYELERMELLATKLKALKERSDELDREWSQLPEVKEHREQELDRAHRQQLVELVMANRDREIREQVKAVGDAVRSALPAPPVEVKTDVLNRIAPPMQLPAEPGSIDALISTLDQAANHVARMYQRRGAR